MADALVLQQVNKIYEGPVPTQVLFDINLTLRQQSFNALVGTSGSGKSTMLNIMGTLDRPTSGDVIVGGHSTRELAKQQLAKLRNQTIGFVFQFHFLLPEFTALENVLMPYRIWHSRVPGEAVSRAEELMKLMGLTKVMNQPANRMSGGQQQRTAIARALMNQPQLILADEPTGNLDSESSEQVYQLLRRVHEEEQTTFLIITHDRKVAERADRIIEINDGRILYDTQR